MSITKELTRVSLEAMDALKNRDIMKVFPTQRPHATTRLVIKTPKTESSNRTVWLPKTLALMLCRYKKEQAALENGNPVESRIVRDRFEALCKQHGFPTVVFHSLRHLSTGYKLKLTGGDLKAVQGDTGHAEVEMVTEVYSRIIDEDRRLNAKKVEDDFYGNLPSSEGNAPIVAEVAAASDGDQFLLEMLKVMPPEVKAAILKQSLQKC